MKHKLIISLLLLSILKVQAQVEPAYPEGIEHVVVIGVDGMSPNGIRKAKTPVMDKMIAGGAIKWQVRTVLPSSSSPNWASMIMGAGVEAHGVLDNDWEKNEASLMPVVRGESGLFPTIFSVVRRKKPAAEIGAVYQWDGFGRLFEKEVVSFNKTFHSEDSTAMVFNQYLLEKRPTFAFLQLDEVDGAGHESGHGTPEYFKAIGKADSLIGNILASIEKAGMTKNTLVIVTADHGGIGFGHGGATAEEAEIAMIFYGAGVKKGYQVKQQVYTYDLAATIAFAMNIVPPYAWTGRPVKSAFAGFEEPSNLWMGREAISAPVIYPDKYLYASAGGLYIDKPALVKMESGADKTDIRYTIDGSQPSLSSALYTAPFLLDKTAVVKARSYKIAEQSLVATAYFRVAKSNKGNGLQTNLYIGENWMHLPPFNELKVAKTWVDHEFILNSNNLIPLLEKGRSTFAVSMSGFISVDVSGNYVFYTQSDDGSQLYIDGQKVVENNDSHGVIERGGSVHLDKGKHAIKVNYFNHEGGFWLNVLYKGPGLEKQMVPADRLFLN